MKYGWLAMMLCFSLVTVEPQSGRVRKEEAPEKPAPGAELPLKLDSSRPVLVNMSPEDFQASGLNKLSEKELDHLDHWFLELLVKLQSLPQSEGLKFEKSRSDSLRSQECELQRQQWESNVRDLQSRLSTINREATRMTFDLNQARLAASRGDWGAVQSALMGLEAAANRISQASQ
ncbi:MAG: hypothetical protein HY314_10985 [Acidobacteria bacterium]|nr:hypothetical protein [Acidobacteriota bacterium]